MNGGGALKTSFAEGGLKKEIETARRTPDFGCFPKLLDWSRGYDNALVEAVQGRFDPKPEYGVELWEMINVLKGIRFSRDEKPVSGKAAVNDFKRNLAEAAGPAWDSLRDASKFLKEHDLHDVSYGNWGVALRDGAEIPVMFDYDL